MKIKVKPEKLSKERWEYLKQDLIALKGTKRYLTDGRTTLNLGRNKKKRELKELEKM